MRLVWAVIPLVLIVSMIGIIGVQESFAGEPLLNMRLVDEFGNSKHNALVDQEIYISNDLANKQDKIQSFTHIIQIKDETNTVVHLSWLTNSLSVGGISSHTLSWTPTESGTYTATAFVWESIDSPISLERTLTITIDVLSLLSSDNLESRITSDVDISKTIQDNTQFQNHLITNTESKTPEITFVLNRETIYGDEGINGIVTSTSDDSLYWYMVDSDGKAVMPYYQNLSRSDDMSKWSFNELDMSSYGRDSFGTTTNIFPPGEYAIVIFNENIEIKKNFTIMESKCCRPLLVSVAGGAYLPGEEFRIYVKTAPQTTLTFNLIDHNGKITQTKQITTNQKGEIKWQSLTLSRIATPGIWTLEVTDEKNTDSIPIIIIPTPDELIKKSPTTEEIMVSYNEELTNKKSGYDVLLASSLEPFVDDGRQYLFPKPGHKPAPNDYFGMLERGHINVTGFETNDYGVVTYVDEPHEKYSIKLHDGYYREDWIPSYIPDGQKLLYATTSYDPTDYWGNLNDQYFVSYNFVPTTFTVDENTNTRDIKYNMGFRVNASYDFHGDEIADTIEGWSDGHDERVDSYGGVRTITQNGEMFVLHDGGYYFEHDPNSVTWFIDNHTYIRASSYYYTLDELIPIIESMIDKIK